MRPTCELLVVDDGVHAVPIVWGKIVLAGERNFRLGLRNIEGWEKWEQRRPRRGFGRCVVLSRALYSRA